jgi:hypothetical protein
MRGIHRRWHPLIRLGVRGGLWLRAVVAIETTSAQTPRL